MTGPGIASTNIDRRRLMAGAAAGAVALTLPGPLLGAERKFRFPRGFLWGTATSPHQVEGNNVNSDCWFLEQMERSIFTQASGDACDHYHRYASDIAMMSGWGLNAYRFGIEWARIEPAPGQFSLAELEHYGRMLDACHAHGITPIVTLHHFTSPLWFAKKGGFENPEAPEAFARYAAKVVEVLGDRISWLSTINEADMGVGPFKFVMDKAARLAGSDRFAFFISSPAPEHKAIVRQAHVAAREAVARLRPATPVGMTLAVADYQDAPGTSGFAEEARHKHFGPYLELARNDGFVGVQTYTRDIYGPEGKQRVPKGVRRTQMGYEFYPEALEGAVRYAAKASGVPVLVTENGIGTEDDADRVEYIDRALAGLSRCMADGVDVRGYIHWSLFDNFEWMLGYRPKFGLVAVNRETQERSPKPSALHLGKIARRNAIRVEERV